MSIADHAIRTSVDSVRLERMLPGPIERVWRFLVDPDKRRQWLAAGEFDLRPGGVATLHFRHADISPDGDVPERRRAMHEQGHVNRGTVTACDPPHRLAWTWGHTADDRSEVEITLATEGDQVRLRLVHRRLAAEDMVGVSSGWHTHLDILRARLHGRDAGDFWAAYAVHEAAYSARLGTENPNEA